MFFSDPSVECMWSSESCDGWQTSFVTTWQLWHQIAWDFILPPTKQLLSLSQVRVKTSPVCLSILMTDVPRLRCMTLHARCHHVWLIWFDDQSWIISQRAATTCDIRHHSPKLGLVKLYLHLYTKVRNDCLSGAFNQEKVVGAFSLIVKSLRRFIASPTVHTVIGGNRACMLWHVLGNS